MGLEVVPVLNKIDLPTADVEKVKKEIEAVIGIDADDAIAISAKTGENVSSVLEAIVARIPPPKPRDTDRLQALIIDSWFDNYLGVVSLVRVMQGEIKPRDKLLVMSTGRTHEVDQVGVFTPKRTQRDKLARGRGRLGHRLDQGRARRAGRRHADPGARSGAAAAAGFPEDAAARVRGPVSGRRRRLSGAARGAGQAQAQRRGAALRAGNRPRRWASASAAASSACCTWRSCRSGWSASTTSNLITTAPTVVYEVLQTDGTMLTLDNPAKLPPAQNVEEIREPIIVANILTPPDYVGNVITLCEEKRGVQRSIQYLGDARCRSATSCRWPKSCSISSTS